MALAEKLLVQWQEYANWMRDKYKGPSFDQYIRGEHLKSAPKEPAPVKKEEKPAKKATKKVTPRTSR